MKIEKKDFRNIVLLGATLDTGNLGVSALAAASVNCILRAYPKAKVSFVGLVRQRKEHLLTLNKENVSISSWPIRFCLNPFVKDHYVRILFFCFFASILPFLKRRINNRTTVGTLLQADCVFDITGGDSFSDIYGVKRYVLGCLVKRLCQRLKGPFVMLPQTYGPFETGWAKWLAKRILYNCDTIFSRDLTGLETIKKLTRGKCQAKLLPDMAFTLEKRRPITQYEKVMKFFYKGCTLVGLNVSGLLYNGGYSQQNQFGLKIDYPELMIRCLKAYLALPDVRILLVPHVVTKQYSSVENDYAVCQKLKELIPQPLQERIFVVEPGLDQSETKSLIGICEFFVGARMHATIAALSQHIPAIGLAYSDKFLGIFKMANVQECVLDLRYLDGVAVITKMMDLFARRLEIQKKLRQSIPVIQQDIYSVFQHEL